jgi:predicted enzyme related to lactoylglutathione lyase
MINGVHALIYTKHADEVRAFFQDVLGFSSVDSGDGWLIFALPPAELGIHPANGDGRHGRHQLYLMCDDVHRTIEELKRKGVEFTADVIDEGWGLTTSIKLPGGSEFGLYEPKHASPLRAAAAEMRSG